MKIVKVETIRCSQHPNILWVRLYSEDGFIGLGEHFICPPRWKQSCMTRSPGLCLGSQPSTLKESGTTFSYSNFFGFAGAEMRALSAVDVALWI